MSESAATQPGTLRLTASDAMVFVKANGVTAGMEALVLAEGTCTLPRLRHPELD